MNFKSQSTGAVDMVDREGYRISGCASIEEQTNSV